MKAIELFKEQKTENVVTTLEIECSSCDETYTFEEICGRVYYNINDKRYVVDVPTIANEWNSDENDKNKYAEKAIFAAAYCKQRKCKSKENNILLNINGKDIIIIYEPKNFVKINSEGKYGLAILDSSMVRFKKIKSENEIEL